jgi:phosphotransferase system enzyme I (PtsI)
MHFDAYRQVAESMAGRAVVIRTLDLGADKMQGTPQSEDERNPFLGLRSIRLSLRNVPLFRIQLRAILRASVLGDVRILFPLISTVHELRQAKMVLADVMEDLQEHGVSFNPQIPIGMMVEVPAAVVMIDHFLPEVDFISIGTNDLVQYTLAVDRGNMQVAGLYNSCDPAVLRLIKTAVDACRGQSVSVNVCGQMSGNPTYTMLLLGLGLRHLSVPPGSIPEIKKVCRSVTVPQCEAVAARVLQMEHAREIKHYLKEELRRILPERAG